MGAVLDCRQVHQDDRAFVRILGKEISPRRKQVAQGADLQVLQHRVEGDRDRAARAIGKAGELNEEIILQHLVVRISGPA